MRRLAIERYEGFYSIPKEAFKIAFSVWLIRLQLCAIAHGECNRTCSCGHLYYAINFLKQPHFLRNWNQNTVQMNLYKGVTCFRQTIFVLPFG